MTAPRARADVNPRAFADSVPYPLLAFVVQQLPSSTGSGGGRETAFIRRWPPPALDTGPHLSYAIQWFSFATVILVGTAVLILRSPLPRPRREAGARGGGG